MGLLGNNPNQNQMYSLLGIDPAAMRRQALFNGLAAAGFQLMGDRNLGNAGGAFLAGTNQARDDHYRTALDAYRLKTDAEDRTYRRQQDEEERSRRAAIDEQNKWRFGQEQNAAELAESQLLGQQSAVNKWAGQVEPKLLLPQNIRQMARQGGVEGMVPYQDEQRYDRMQPYMQAQDYGGAFQQMTAQPEAPAEFTLGEGQVRYRGNQPIAAGPPKGPGTNFMGTIPPGYQMEYDNQGRPVRMVPIPGGPAAAEAEKAGSVAEAQQNKRMTLTDTVTGAADAARDLVGTMSTGLIGQGMSYWGESNAAEVYRQTDVLKSTATIENLNAMRRESPTGGALGNVTEKEGAMLAAAAGALDPASGEERFQQQLDNYELALMRVIHGYEAGTQMFLQRKAMKEAQQPQEGQRTEQSGSEQWTIDEQGNPVRVR